MNKQRVNTFPCKDKINSKNVMHPKYFEAKRCVHFVRMKVVQNGTEGQAVSPGSAEVCDLYAVIFVGDALTPLEQRLAGVHKILKEKNFVLVRMNILGFV